MAQVAGTSSPAPGAFKTLQEEIGYYKSQYEHLESELQDFQASSKELEAEMEKDIEASEKREKDLKQKVESLRYEVDEWKTKYKQSKAEANTAQNNLQKEITTLRDTNRTQLLKLRDIEVANDDFERQARHTTSSLEDIESKYNVALERSVMMEEEMRASEQERENLRIESQRLRDELSDLKIEAEITGEKLRNVENQGALQYKRISQNSDSKSQTPQSPASSKSTTTVSTNAISTPPASQSEASVTPSETLTPPSPPSSEASAPLRADPIPEKLKRSVSKSDANITPRPLHYSLSKPAHTRGPSLAVGAGATRTPTFNRRHTAQKPQVPHNHGLPRDRSLYQIRGLIGKMQKLEERVHSARSKLPAPTSTPPRASPRGTTIPATVTVRSSKKRSNSNAAESEVSATPTRPTEQNTRRPSHRLSRISIGASIHDTGISRPSSRASHSSQNDGFTQPTQSHRASLMARPPSRTQGTAAEARRPRSSLSGRATPSHAHRPSTGGASTTVTERRPRSSIGGRATSSHASRSSVSGTDVGGGTFFEDGEGDASFATPTQRRTTMDKSAGAGADTGIPTPRVARRQSNISIASVGAMRPPDRKTSQEVGETF